MTFEALPFATTVPLLICLPCAILPAAVPFLERTLALFRYQAADSSPLLGHKHPSILVELEPGPPAQTRIANKNRM